MDDLIEWLRAQLDSERKALADLHKCCMQQWYSTQELFDGWGPLDWDEAEHIATYGPGRMLAEVEAKRRIVDRAELVLHAGPDDRDPESETGTKLAIPGRRLELVRTLRLLALPYADRSGYRDEWRP